MAPRVILFAKCYVYVIEVFQAGFLHFIGGLLMRVGGSVKTQLSYDRELLV